MPVTSLVSKFRLLLGDTPAAHGLTSPRPDPDPEFQAAALLNDGEVQFFLDSYPSSILLAVAAACDALAARFTPDPDETEDGQSFKNSEVAKSYLAMAARFRQRAKDETAATLTGAGLPTGSVPSRIPTTWQEVY